MSNSRLTDISSSGQYDVIKEHLDSILKSALERLPEPYKQPYLISENLIVIEELVARLKGNIPPNEVGELSSNQPASLPNILNAGWTFYFYKQRKPVQSETHNDVAEINRLVLKAIESSFVHQRFAKETST